MGRLEQAQSSMVPQLEVELEAEQETWVAVGAVQAAGVSKAYSASGAVLAKLVVFQVDMAAQVAEAAQAALES